jgi:hypothetical protein
MKPKNTGAALRTQTASWQYDSADYAEGMDNKDHPSYKMLTKYCGNQHSGRQDPNQTINKGRAAANLKGNTGATANLGPKQPAVDGVPASIKIKNPDYINGGAQVRTPGGTRPFDPKAGQNYSGNADKINMGRGPTKGNKQ